MEVFSLSHEHSTDDVDYTHEVKELLTESDIDQFSELCDDGMLVDSDECDLYEEYYRHVSEGRTQFAQVSYGMTTNEQDDEDEATGWGGHRTTVAQHYFYLFHQMSAYISYLEHRSPQENAYFNEFMVSFWFFWCLSLADRDLNR